MRILRTTFLLTALTIVLMLVGSYFGGRNGMTIALMVAIATNAFAYFFWMTTNSKASLPTSSPMFAITTF